jgi:hypothetical protein
MKPQYIKIDAVGNKCYFSDKEMTIFHREDGPACEYSDGTKTWFINDNYHREDGPAIECKDGYNEWWVDGKYFTEDKFKTRMSNTRKTPCNGKKVIVDGIEYTLTVK